MRWIDDLTKAVKARTILFSLTILIATYLVINYLILGPNEKTVQTLKQNLDGMTENYIQMKSENLVGLLNILKVEVEQLEQKEKRISDSVMAQEEIPLMVSKLEVEASKSGLAVTSSVVQNKNKSESAKMISIDLTFTGSFQEVMTFLSALQSWDEILFINHFNVKKKLLTEH